MDYFPLGASIGIGVLFALLVGVFMVTANKTPAKRVEQVKKPLHQLDYGWHSDDEKVETEFKHPTLAYKKFDDGCVAIWSKTFGTYWDVYNHPVDIVDNDMVYLPNPEEIGNALQFDGTNEIVPFNPPMEEE